MPSTIEALYRNSKLPLEERLSDLLGRMTLEEKVAQLTIFHMQTNVLPDQTVELDESTRSRLANGIGGLGRPGQHIGPRETAVATNAIQKHLREQTRLGIPAFFIDEALHGLMAAGSTSFPQAIGLASTWDPDLVEQVFEAASQEMRARGENWALTPVLDLAREPRWGRTEETYGEDPYLGSRIGVAAVRGLQGRELPIGPEHVLATAKHFAAHGQPEGGRNCAPANFAEGELRENYLAAFQAAVQEAGVGSVMASYNEINGIPVHIHPWLLDQVLRQEWGFPGLLVSDGNGITMLETFHHVAASKDEATRKALKAGIDFELDTCYSGTLLEQVRSGAVPETWVDRAAERVLRAKFLLGLFDHPYADPDKAERVTNDSEHRQLALQAARKSLVLLKNDGLLPLDPGEIKTLAVIGPNAAGLHLGGYSADPGRGVTILEGIRQKAGGRMNVIHAEGCKITADDFGGQAWRGWHENATNPPDPVEDDRLLAEALKQAKKADVVLLVLGETESISREAWSELHLGDRDSLDLPGRQNDLVRGVLAMGVPTVALLINGRPLSVNELAEHANALFEGWYLGQEGGTAFAEALFGETNPGGRLPITFPRSVGQVPAFYNHKPSVQRSYVLAGNGSLFPFGHGLSYTTFAYKNLQVSPARIPPDGQALVRVEVTNTGKRAGDEVVQLYVHDVTAEMVTRPVKQLKGFRRITLQPGERQFVEFTLGVAELSYVNEKMEKAVEPGAFEIMVGGSSAEVQTAQLEVIP
ncbi:MAG TPA: glycoside hydrolase family 3 N-terminal domain-containing protein [Anaerolineales bacterium]|nr:glycoside hydrolase family 3 N-terminal domain-containing protein [Anaerolineales bacterium]